MPLSKSAPKKTPVDTFLLFNQEIMQYCIWGSNPGSSSKSKVTGSCQEGIFPSRILLLASRRHVGCRLSKDIWILCLHPVRWGLRCGFPCNMVRPVERHVSPSGICWAHQEFPPDVRRRNGEFKPSKKSNEFLTKASRAIWATIEHEKFPCRIVRAGLKVFPWFIDGIVFRKPKTCAEPNRLSPGLNGRRVSNQLYIWHEVQLLYNLWIDNPRPADYDQWLLAHNLRVLFHDYNKIDWDWKIGPSVSRKVLH